MQFSYQDVQPELSTNDYINSHASQTFQIINNNYIDKLIIKQEN